MALVGEFEIIARYFAPLAAGHAGAFGLSDDAAVVRPAEGCEFVVTNDALVERVHYRSDDPPRDIARKALRVNLSDLAAMGAVPRFYNLALALSPAIDEDWLAGFAGGLAEDQDRFGLCLIGGDTVSTPGPMMVAVTAMGEVPVGRALRRGGARDGDRIFVSGTIGDAGAGLGILAGRIAVGDADRARLVERYRVPSPRTALGPALVGLAHAAIDARVIRVCAQRLRRLRRHRGSVPRHGFGKPLEAGQPSAPDGKPGVGETSERVIELPRDGGVKPVQYHGLRHDQ
ncbi:MAG: thiamine-phosphate kinase, partial [Bauldia litoralis]